ncbi:MAG: hypothetical protein IAI48_00300 [Candidatus Eremiobacteraeota bacterium]|nr:hypothetical protein [Candidatus Eremiobacteraeota bacterium]
MIVRFLSAFALVAIVVSSRAAVAAGLPEAAVPVLPAAPAIDGRIGDAWSQAASVSLGSDFTNRRNADETTAVRVAQIAGALVFAFDVTQSEPIVASTTTNGSSVTGDDYVGVALSPNGPLGFQYVFYANPAGARYQTSSENSAYTPSWDAAVVRRTGGYTATLRIPLVIIRSGGRTTWRAQFFRATVHANALDVWAYDEHQSNFGDATYFGTLDGIGNEAGATTTRPRPRAQIYGLGELTTKANGGDTSRVGADFALPVSPTASLLASIHPDYSNVETDQQSISPTAFPRSYAEVRPFFTQAAQSFNNTFSCTNCPQLLYTPSIPTYRDAYAAEGTQGPLTFAAFDAVGVRRDDSAETLDYFASNTYRAMGVSVQNVTVNEGGGFRDEVSSLAAGALNQHSHLGAYLDYGTESGTDVADSRQGTYYQTGVFYATATTTGVLDWQHLGAAFAPADAYVAQNDVTGPQLYLNETIPFKAKTILHDLSFNTYLADFENHARLPSQNDLGSQVNVDFSDLLTVHAFYSETAVRTEANEYLPFDGSGVLVGYKYATTTPTYVQFDAGPYYHGRLVASVYLTTLPVLPKVKVTLEADRSSYDTAYRAETSGTQWLERASLDYQANKETQFDLGVRRIIGPALPVSFAPPNFTPLNASNVTAALHFLSRSGRSEIYLVYGDPNSLVTTPAFFAKYIFYLGAPKGT